MTIIKSKTFWIMLFVLVLGCALRLIFINKPDGLWNDEYVSWAIASIPLGKNFLDAVIAQCHMPLYYFFLKFVMIIFGSDDLTLRLSSVVVGIFAIVSMYFVGREYKDEKLGLLCASVTSFSSFLIYFSQEVRFYELLFLFSTFMLLFTLKLGKNQTSKNLAGYIISSLLVILTHTIGFIFIFFNSIFLSAWVLKINNTHNKIIKKLWAIAGITTLCAIPIASNIITHHPLSQWWDKFSFAKIGFFFTDYFSPILTNIVSSPDNFFYNLTGIFIIFALIPTAIAIFAIIKALNTKQYEILGLTLSSFAFLAALILLSIFGKLVFLTKYSIEIYPILILLVSYGFLQFSELKRKLLIFTFISLNLLYLTISIHSAPKLHRAEGHKIVANLLKNAKLNNGDIILLNYYPKDRFERYFDFSNYRVISYNKGNFSDYIKLEPEYSRAKLNNKIFDEKFESEIISKLKPSQKLAIVVLNSVAVYSPVQLQEISKDENTFNKTPYLFVAFSFLKNESLNQGLKKLHILQIEEKGQWAVITFIK